MKHARLERLQATAQLIHSGNTSILPDGTIVARGTPGSNNYESVNKSPELAAAYLGRCEARRKASRRNIRLAILCALVLAVFAAMAFIAIREQRATLEFINDVYSLEVQSIPHYRFQPPVEKNPGWILNQPLQGTPVFF